MATPPLPVTTSHEEKEWNGMYYLDHRLSKILSDIRIERARQIRERKLITRSSDQIKQRLGLWLIAQGESLADGKRKAA